MEMKMEMEMEIEIDMETFIKNRIDQYCTDNNFNSDPYFQCIVLIKKHLPSRLLTIEEMCNFTGSDLAVELLTFDSQKSAIVNEIIDSIQSYISLEMSFEEIKNELDGLYPYY